MKHTKYLLAIALIVSTVANSTVFALSVTEAVNSMQWPVASEVPSVSNPRGNIGYILSNIFYGSTDGALNGKIKTQYLDLSGVSGGSSVWTASGGVASYTGAASIANGLTVTAGNVNLPVDSVDSNEIANGSLLFADWNQNGCTNNQIPKWSTGSGAWVCGDVGLTTETDPLWTTQSGAYVKKTDYASSTTNGVLTSADWSNFNSKLSGSGGTINMLPKFTVGGVLANSLIYDDGTKIGIGTNSPTQRLDVNGNIIVQGSGSLFFRDTNNGISSPSLNQLAFNTNGVGRIMIDTTGYVGIGMTEPSEMLEVNGNIKLSGASASYRVMNVASPIGDYDAANKVYVDTKVSAAGGSGVASQYLSDGSYYSEGGSPYFCRLNVLSGTSQRIVSVNQNKLCNSTSNLYCNAGLCNADASILTNIKNNYQLIGAKDNQSCSIADGQVYCWGYTGNGQKYIDFSRSHITGVNMHSCAVTGNGQIKCWGYNNYGQLGNGNTSTQSSPVTVIGINNAVKVVTSNSLFSTSYARTCAILASGQIKCWGYLSGLGAYSTPELVTGVTNAVDISITNDQSGAQAHWCAVLATGSVVCAGDNTYGQLGNGTNSTTNMLSPVTVNGITNATRVITAGSYSSSYASSCAILSDGTTKCWGWRSLTGRLGDGNATNGSVTSPVGQAGIRSSSGMSISPTGYAGGQGYGHACEVETDGTVKCWGYGADYQLGNGSTASSAAPITVSGITNAVKVYTASSGHSTTQSYGKSCALLTDKTVRCWGYLYGHWYIVTPTAITGLTNVVDFAMTQWGYTGNASWCAVISDGTARCGGVGQSYQLGNGASNNYWFLNSAITVTGLTNAVKIYVTMTPSSSNGRACALTSDGTVKCWGIVSGGVLYQWPTALSGITNAVDFSMSQMNTNGAYDGHWCAVLASGVVKCAGAGGNGQLGNGGYWDSPWWTPVTVSGITNAVKVYTSSAGYTTTTYGTSCALLSDGTVKCWGYMNNNTQAATPVTLTGISDATDVSLSQTADNGVSHYCVLLSNRTVMCGGAGGNGQLWNGANSSVSWTTPVVVTGISNATAIYTSGSLYGSSGNSMSCALLSDNQIKCWGTDGGYGRMGDGTMGSIRNFPGNLASPVVNAVDYSISPANGGTGNGHSCAVQSNGTVKCWGYGANGQLGNGTQLSSVAPVTVLGITNAIRVYTANAVNSTDYGRSCALLADGTVKCWGMSSESSVYSIPVAITGISNAIDFSMSDSAGPGGHYCAVLATGSVMCSGNGEYGQLGNGTSTTTNWYTSPVMVTGITNAVKVIASSSGYSTTYWSSCALLSDGTIKCWGHNNSGQLGNGNTSSSNTPVTVSSTNGMYYVGVGSTTVDKSIPAAKDGITAATSVAVGSYHACAVEGGTAKCWGYNAEGQLGNNSTTASSSPVGVFGISNATQIATGYMHTCAILTDSTVRCWGLNAEGQLGNGNTNSSLTPVAVSGITNAVQISAGDYHTCATLADGTIKCWGLNTNGQLGQGSVALNYSSTPVTVPGITAASRIALGDAYGCATTSTGSVYCWGENKWGQIGNATYTAFVATPYLVPGITTASRIGTGSNHACAVLSDGTMKCWGLNASAQQGSTGYYSTATPVALLGMTNILTMVGGMSHTCTISTDLGSANCFGYNRNGQLGNGTTAASTNPSLLTYPTTGTSDTTIYQVSLCETRDIYTGNLGGIDGANSICAAQCGKGYKMVRESEMANFKNSATSANIYWIDRSQANNCNDWTDSSVGNNGATMQFGLITNTGYASNYLTAPATAACNTSKQLLCERGVR